MRQVAGLPARGCRCGWRTIGLLLLILSVLCETSPAYSVDISLGEALDNTSLEWTTKGAGGEAVWGGQDNVHLFDGDAAESGPLDHDQGTSLSTIVAGPGRISFWWRVSSEEEYDYLRFTVNGIEMARISGEVGWQELSFDVPPGRQALSWYYRKDVTISGGQDRGWVDAVEYEAELPPRPPGTLEVCTSGCPYDTIQGAVDDAVDGDTILVREGTYSEFISVYDKTLAIRSTAGAAGTIITPPSEGAVFTVEAVWPLPVVIEGFTITNGGAGANGTAQVKGGAVYCLESVVEVRDSVLTGNRAPSGSGIRGEDCSLTVSGSTISDNIGRAISWTGNSSYWDTLLIEDSIVSRNNAGSCGAGNCTGGGIDAKYGAAVTISGSLIEDNHALYWGGGLFINAPLTMRRSTVRGNSSSSISGGGIFTHGTVLIEDSLIIENTAQMHGGGIYFDTASRDGSTIRRSVVAGNEAGGSGGALSIRGSDSFDIVNTVISGNRSVHGSAIIMDSYSVGTTVVYPLVLSLVNSTVSGNNSSPRANEVISASHYDEPGEFHALNTIFHGNSPAPLVPYKFPPNTSFSYSNVTNGFSGEGNIDLDPLFVDPRSYEEAPTAEGNYHLLPASPSIDAGTDDTAAWPILPSDDIDGHERPQGPRPDMGADEHVFRGDWNADGSPDLFWRKTSSGKTALWHMDGRTVVDGIAMPSTGSVDWSVASTDDFNGDGKPDLLWRNGVSGANHLWYLDGPAVIGSTPLPSVGTSWALAATADFDIDNDPDLLWRNTASGANYIWYMDGSRFTGGAALPSAGPEWRVAAADDFNGDGHPDLMWRQGSSGRNFIWHLEGAAVTDCVPLPSAGSSWYPGMAADFNRDGSPDILWRNGDNGDNYLWYLSGGTVTGGDNVLPLADTVWRIEP